MPQRMGNTAMRLWKNLLFQNDSKMIVGHRNRDATVSEGMGSSDYAWEGGKRTGIDWYDTNLSGSQDVSGCTNLISLFCYKSNSRKSIHRSS